MSRHNDRVDALSYAAMMAMTGGGTSAMMPRCGICDGVLRYTQSQERETTCGSCGAFWSDLASDWVDKGDVVMGREKRPPDETARGLMCEDMRQRIVFETDVDLVSWAMLAGGGSQEEIDAWKRQAWVKFERGEDVTPVMEEPLGGV